jgi:Co/Zn/Cd efflux system component
MTKNRRRVVAKPRSELKSTGYEIFVGILSVLSIVNLVLLLVVRDESLDTVLDAMNALFSVIFLADFIYRILTAPSAAAYFFKHFGWADLLASLPFPQFKVLRVFRLIRVYRLLRQVGIRTIGRTLIKDRAGSALYVLLLMGILVLQFGSLTILAIEHDADGANITTASDALWYTIVTISTVVIIVIGVGIFGTFTGYLATVFLSPKISDQAAPIEPGEVSTEAGPEPSATTVAELRSRLGESEAKLAEIRRMLA